MKRTRIKTSGKRTKAWTKERNRLKKQFAALGITRCEAQLEGCMNTDGLGFAHTKKRRHLTEDEMSRVALLCNNCHGFYELQGEAKMQPAIEAIISSRADRLLDEMF